MRSLALALALVVLGGGCQDSLVSRELGARCDQSDECDDRCLPASEGFPGGFCTISCNAPADCVIGAACVEPQGGVCLFECSNVRDCDFLGSGWTCADVESRHDPALTVKVCLGA